MTGIYPCLPSQSAPPLLTMGENFFVFFLGFLDKRPHTDYYFAHNYSSMSSDLIALKGRLSP